MGLQDLYIITAILGLALLSLGARALYRYGRNLIGAGEAPSGEITSELSGKRDKRGRESVLDRIRELNISFSESDRQYPWDPEKECLLDFIESKGIEVECLCGAGECGSCRTRLIEGEVEYLLEPKVAPGDGYCLLCVTVPKTHLVLAR